MSNFELKKKAVELIKRYLAMEIKTKNIVLLEADIIEGKCTYLFFSICGSPVSYVYTNRFYKSFAIYPNNSGINGTELEWIEE